MTTPSELSGTAEPADVAEAPVLAVSGLSIAYGGTVAVSGVGFEVRAGETVALVGESGSGKSTTALAIAGLLSGGARILSGSVRFRGRELVGVPERELKRIRGRHIGLVPQDPTLSLDPTQRIGTQVAESLVVHGVCSRREAKTRAVELLASAGLSEPERRAGQYPHQLSGGMRQRVLIGIAWACGPGLIVADEPTSALDVTVQRQVLDRLDELRASTGAAVLLITHDLAVAADRAQHLVVMSHGQVVESGRTAEVLASPSHPYTAELLAATPGHRIRIADRLDAVESAEAPKAPLVRATALVKDFDARRADGSRHRFRAVDSVGFDIPRDHTLAIVGESGSGKSTTARLVMALDRPTSGSVTFDGVDLSSAKAADLRRLRRRFQLIQQNPYSSLDPRWTVEKIIEEPLRAFGGLTAAERRTRSAELLDQVRLPADFARRLPRELSGGQRQRVAIARALALRPDLVVCDEPVSALDVSVQATILDLLMELKQQLGLSYLFISHDLSVVQAISDDVAVMRAGAIVEKGPAQAVFTAPEHEYTQSLLNAVPGRERVGI